MGKPPADGPRVDVAWHGEQRSSRLHVRISPEFKASLEQAAQRRGTSVSDFVTTALRARVDEVLAERWVVPDDYFDQLMQALDDPPEPLPWIAETARRREEILRDVSLHDAAT